MHSNVDVIVPLLEFPSEDTFYFMQVIKRRKDNPGMDKDQRVVRDFFIDSLESLNKQADDIQNLCKVYNARAYIWLNRRSYRRVALTTMKNLAVLVAESQYKSVKTCYATAAGTTNEADPKRWIVDVDDAKDLNGVRAGITSLHKETGKPYSILAEIPTKSGWHIISEPFNTTAFRYAYPQIDVHKDNPTILYHV